MDFSKVNALEKLFQNFESNGWGNHGGNPEKISEECLGKIFGGMFRASLEGPYGKILQESWNKFQQESLRNIKGNILGGKLVGIHERKSLKEKKNPGEIKGGFLE